MFALIKMARKPKQLELRPRTWGGKRDGAGRPARERRPMPHRPRAAFVKPRPLHVTFRTADGVYGLRSRRSLRAVEGALRGGADRFGCRVVQMSIQGNHVHMLVEAPDQISLARAMKGLAVRFARRMNAMMGRAGQVVGERYHARELLTPTEVRSAMHYIRYNHQHHGLSEAVVDEYSSDGLLAAVLPAAKLWLVTVGWQRGRPPR
jgi:putative transposase